MDHPVLAVGDGLAPHRGLHHALFQVLRPRRSRRERDSEAHPHRQAEVRNLRIHLVKNVFSTMSFVAVGPATDDPSHRVGCAQK